jgi:hypothetical protein
MSQIIRNSGFATQDIVTAAKLHNLVDTAQLGPEAITSQTVIPEGLSVSGDVVLGVDVSVGAIRKFALSDILENNLSCNFTGVTLGLKEATDFVWGTPEVAIKGELRISFPNVEDASPDEEDNPVGATAPEGATYSDAFVVSKRTPINYEQTDDEPEETINDLLQTVKLDKTGIISASAGEFIFHTRKNGVIRFGSVNDQFIQMRKVGQTGALKDTYCLAYNEESGTGSLQDRLNGQSLMEIGPSSGFMHTIFQGSTIVQFLGSVRLASGSIYIGEAKADIADEITIDLGEAASGVYDYTATVVSEALWSSAGGDTRVAAINVPTSGKIMLEENFVVPAKETWTVEYEGHYTDGGDDAATTVWLLDNVVSKTYQFSNESNDGKYIGHQFVLDGGAEGVTFNIKVRGAVNSGSGSDAFTLFDDKYLSKRRITKFRDKTIDLFE